MKSFKYPSRWLLAFLATTWSVFSFSSGRKCPKRRSSNIDDIVRLVSVKSQSQGIRKIAHEHEFRGCNLVRSNCLVPTVGSMIQGSNTSERANKGEIVIQMKPARAFRMFPDIIGRPLPIPYTALHQGLADIVCIQKGRTSDEAIAVCEPNQGKMLSQLHLFNGIHTVSWILLDL